MVAAEAEIVAREEVKETNQKAIERVALKSVMAEAINLALKGEAAEPQIVPMPRAQADDADDKDNFPEPSINWLNVNWLRMYCGHLLTINF